MSEIVNETTKVIQEYLSDPGALFNGDALGKRWDDLVSNTEKRVNRVFGSLFKGSKMASYDDIKELYERLDEVDKRVDSLNMNIKERIKK